MKARKILVSLAALALVAAISIGGTIAYLTSQQTVTNTFSVGNVKITMDEAKVNQDGEQLYYAGGEENANTEYSNVKEEGYVEAKRVQANGYKLMPGHTYTKDPIIHVDTASEDCYLFVTIKNEITAIEATGKTVADQMKANGWAEVTGKSNLYVYVGKNAAADALPLAVAKGTNVNVFEQIVIADTVDDVSGYLNKTIVVNAYAVQKDGFVGKTATEIWDAAFNSVTLPTA